MTEEMTMDMPLRAVELLKRLIATPSLSRREENSARLLADYLAASGAEPRRLANNVWCLAPGFHPSRPTLLLNSHHDTVRPSAAWSLDPFGPVERQGRLYGLGSNDAGASLSALLHVFLYFMERPLPFNLMLALTAEEEVTGENGMRMLARHWSDTGMTPAWGIVGEPTGMDVAVGERGLVVLDCVATARGGHAARPEGENAIYKALDDIARLRHHRFEKESALLGPVRITATQIAAGRQHNVLPEECSFVLDVRTTDAMTNEETVERIRRLMVSEATPRSTRLRASAIAPDHPLVRAAERAGARAFVSPTMSDQAVLPTVDTIKIGPGRSERSHTPDEYVEIKEIEQGICRYIQIIRNLANETLEQGI